MVLNLYVTLTSRPKLEIQTKSVVETGCCSLLLLFLKRYLETQEYLDTFR